MREQVPVAPNLRDVRPDDLESLYELDQVCFEPGISYSRSEIRRFLRLPTARGVAAVEEGRIAGFAIGYLPRPGVGNVLTLDVHPDRRRRGAGRRLLEELLARLRAAGAERVQLEVDAENRGAIAFYERLGFRTIERISDYYGNGRDAFEMSLELPV